MLIHQSDLAAFSRCAQQLKLDREVRSSGEPVDTLSATIYGTVIHYAAQVMEGLHAEGHEDACERAIGTFEYYWHPDKLATRSWGTRGEVVGDIVWLPRQSWGGLQVRGRRALRAYWEVLRQDPGQLLALEQDFRLPIDLDDVGIHEVGGQIDRIALRAQGRKIFLSVEDNKTGKKPTYLRYALQWTVYCWATTRPSFWDVFGDDLPKITEPLARRGLALFKDGSGLPIIPRRGRWNSFTDGFDLHDVGWRTEVDYARMKIAMHEYVRSNEAGIFPLTMTGQACLYCPHSRNGKCGGIPIAKITEGEPTH